MMDFLSVFALVLISFFITIILGVVALRYVERALREYRRKK